jgi:hypothetical protein
MPDRKTSPGRSVLEVAGAMMPSGLGQFLSLLAKGSDALADALKARDEKRWKSFLRAALEGDVFPENAEDMTGEDFLEMYRMCLNDIEAEKAELYGRLATAIARGDVSRTLRFPLMMSLAQLTHDQVQRLRKVYIAEVHELVSDGVVFRRHAHEFLGGKSAEDRWDLDRMVSLLVVKDKSLTDLGKSLVAACFRSDDLQPSSIGERTWNGHEELEVLGVKVARRRPDVLDDVETKLARLARDYGRKVDFVPMYPQGDILAPSPLGFPCFVVLVGPTTKPLMKCQGMIQSRMDVRKTPIFASPGAIPGELRAAFPAARFIDNQPEPAVLAAAVLETVKGILADIGDTF